jgi:FkbM family methyltransferase
MQLKPDEVVADVGAGNGEMAVAMAEKVGPSGRVFANEIDPERLEEISQLAQSAGLRNVTVVKGGERDTALTVLDAAFPIRSDGSDSWMKRSSAASATSVGSYANGALAVSLSERMAIIETSAAAIR